MGLDLRKLSESLNSMVEVDNHDDSRKYTYACEACGYTVNTNEELKADMCPNCGGTLKKHENELEDKQDDQKDAEDKAATDIDEGTIGHAVTADGHVFYTLGADDLDFSKLTQNADKSYTSPDGKIIVGRAADLKVAYPDQFTNTDPDAQVVVAPSGDSKGVQDFLATLGFTLGEDADPEDVNDEDPDDEAPTFKYETSKGTKFESPVEIAAYVDDATGEVVLSDGFAIVDDKGNPITDADLKSPADEEEAEDDVEDTEETDESVNPAKSAKNVNLKERSLIRHLNRAFKRIYEDDDLKGFQVPQVVDINDATLSGQKLTLMMTVKFEDGETQDTTITLDGFDGKSGRFNLTPEDDTAIDLKDGDSITATADVKDEGPQDESLIIRSINYNIKAKSMNESVNSDRVIRGRA